MFDAIRKLIKGLLRVPTDPQPPAGDPRSLKVFLAAPGFYRYRLVRWAFKQVGTLFGLLLGLAYFTDFDPLGLAAWIPFDWGADWPWFHTLELLAAAFYVIQLPFSLLLVKLDYSHRWYMVTDRSLRIREGIWNVQERTMTFSNLQNLSIRQGPLDRLFGIAHLEVRSAGGGASTGEQQGAEGENLHVAYFRGVDNADEIRTIIMDRLRKMRAAGLGDPDEPTDRIAQGATALAEGASAEGALTEPAVLVAARLLAKESHALVRALQQ